VAFSPNGRFIAGGNTGVPSRNHATGAQIWDWRTGREIRRFEGHGGWVYAVAFSPDGRSLLTGSDDTTARHWDVATGREIREFAGHSGAVRTVGFSPNGRFVVTGSSDCTTRIWESATGRLVATIVSFREGGWAVVDSEGRYDASDKENTPGVYWLAGDHVIELRKRGEQYFTPGLLAHALGFAPQGSQ
jgi:WD40 repeat protein